MTFLIDTYRTETLKTTGVWSQIPLERMAFRPEPRARTPLEHMVHQCLSEDAWMTNMLGITTGRPPLPDVESRETFVRHYAELAAMRAHAFDAQSADWWMSSAKFFDVERSRAWILTRRIAHSAHHRGQLTMYIRVWGQPLYSTYGPTADTGGLAKNGATVVYFDPHHPTPLPGTGPAPVTERPND